MSMNHVDEAEFQHFKALEQEFHEELTAVFDSLSHMLEEMKTKLKGAIKHQQAVLKLLQIRY